MKLMNKQKIIIILLALVAMAGQAGRARMLGPVVS